MPVIIQTTFIIYTKQIHPVIFKVQIFLTRQNPIATTLRIFNNKLNSRRHPINGAGLAPAFYFPFYVTLCKSR